MGAVARREDRQQLVELPCGVHEAESIVDPCPLCARARAATRSALAAMPVRELTRRAQAQRIERGREALEALHEEAKMGESRYTAEQMADAVRRTTVGGERKIDVAKELGCSTALVGLWITAARKAGTAPPRDVAAEIAKRRAPKDAAPSTSGASKANRPLAVPKESARASALRSTPRTPSAPRERVEARSASHEDVISFLGSLPAMPWAVGDAIRLLAFSAIDGDRDDVVQARERIDGHLRSIGAAS